MYADFYIISLLSFDGTGTHMPCVCYA